MKWCVHDLQILSFCLNSIHMNNLFLQFCHVCIVHFFADHLEKACFFGFSLVHSLNSIPIGNCLNFSHDSAVMWRCDLCTILPVYFVSIVFRRIMACSYHNTRNTAKLSQCKRKFRCWTQSFKTIGFDAIGIKTQSCFLRKLGGHMAGIKCNRYTFLFSALFFDVICQSLSCFCHSIYIHPIGSGPDHTSKSTGSERKILIKTILNLFLISGNGLKLCFRFLIKNRVCTPLLIF